MDSDEIDEFTQNDFQPIKKVFIKQQEDSGSDLDLSDDNISILNPLNRTFNPRDYSKIEQVDLDYMVQHEKRQQELLKINYQRHKIEIRDYQFKLFQDSVETPTDVNNSIIFLETGFGKTAVSMMHIYYYIKKVKYGKKIIFLGQTIQLVEQQCAQIRTQLYDIAMDCERKMPEVFNRYSCEKDQFDIEDLKNPEFMQQFVRPIHADKQILNKSNQEEQEMNRWNKEKWEAVMEESTIFVMIGQILLNALRRGYIKLSDISLIVFDECHNARSEHPFRLIKEEFYDDLDIRNFFVGSDQVKFLGLTASPVLKLNVEKVLRNRPVSLPQREFRLELLQLCVDLNAKIVCTDTQIKKQSNEIITYEQDQTSEQFKNTFQQDFPELKQLFDQLSEAIPKQAEEMTYGVQILVRQILHQLTDLSIILLYQLGRFAFMKYLKRFNTAYSNIFIKFRQQKGQKKLVDEECLTKIGEVLTRNIDEIDKLNGYGNINNYEVNFSSKFRALLDYIILELKKQIQIDESSVNERVLYQKYLGIDSNLELPQMMIFVTSKLIAKYMHELIEDLKTSEVPGFQILQTRYVVGIGRSNEISAHQDQILQQKNLLVINEIQERHYFINKAESLYQSLRIDKLVDNDVVDEDKNGIKNLDLEGVVDRNIIKNLEEVGEGIQKRGRKLNEMIFDLKQQIDVIDKFRKKEFNILISTNVTEEGFDIPDCKYVFAYDNISSLKQYIQQKGRARQENSYFVVVSNQKPKTIQTQLKIYDQSLSLIKYIAKEYSQQDLNSLSKELTNLKNEKMMINKQGDAQLKYPLYERTLVARISLINTNWTNNILTSYVNYIQGERSGIKNDYFLRGPLFYYVNYAGLGFVCYIVLPKFAKKRFFFGDLKDTKIEAKRSATYRAVLEMRRDKELDEHLNPSKSRLVFYQNRLTEWKEDLTDQTYKSIVEQTVITKEEYVNELGSEPICQGKQRYFESYINQAFDIHFMGGPTQQEFEKQNLYQFTLYSFKFKYNQSKFQPDFLKFNDPSDQEIGLLHVFQHKPESFLYKIEKTGQQVLMEPLEEPCTLNFEQYRKLKQIHQFITASVKKWDVQYYSSILKEKIKVELIYIKLKQTGGSYDQNKKEPDFLSLSENNLTAILVLLYRKDDGQLDIDYKKYEPIFQYIEYMKNVFKYANNIKENQMLQKQQQNDLLLNPQPLNGDQKVEKVRWRKIAPHQQHKQFIESLDEKGINVQQYLKDSANHNYIMQNISDNMYMGKFVLNALELSKDAEQLKHIKMNELITRGQKLEKQINNYEYKKDKYVVSAKILFKYLKKLILQFIGEKQNDHSDQKRYTYHQSEWAKYPLNIETFFKLRLLQLLVLPKVRDYFLAIHLKTNILRKQVLKSMTFKEQNYKLQVLKTFIFEEEVEFLQYLKNQNDENCSYIDVLKNNLKCKQDFQRNEFIAIPKKNKLSNDIISDIPNQLIYQALCSSKYNGDYDSYEQLEILGDAVLKLLASLQVFMEYQFVMEGELHIRRSHIIRNENLRQISIKQKIFYYIMMDCFPYNPPEFVMQTVLDPSQLVEEEDSMDEIIQEQRGRMRERKMARESDGKRFDMIKYKNDRIIDIPDHYKYIPEKVHADVVESIIGSCFAQHRSLDACQLILHSMGILNQPSIKLQYIDSDVPRISSDSLLWNNFEIVEKIIGYKFQNPNFILQAFSHLSFYNQLERYRANLNSKLKNSDLSTNLLKSDKMSLRDIMAKNKNGPAIDNEVIDQLNKMGISPFLSYERLEYLGDAVLDCVVIQWLVDKFPNDTPGELSLKKSAIVCNKALALVTIYYKLERFILHENLHIRYQKVLNKIRTEYDRFYKNINEVYEKEGMVLYYFIFLQVKILGDIIESIIGAVFIDSNLNYELTKSVILLLMEEHFMVHFSSTNQLINHPQDKLQAYLKSQNYNQVEVKALDVPPKDGLLKFALQEVDGGKSIKEVWAMSDKEAYEIIYEDISKRSAVLKK